MTHPLDMPIGARVLSNDGDKVGTVTGLHDVPIANWRTGAFEGSYPCAIVLWDGAVCERHMNAHYLRVQG